MNKLAKVTAVTAIVAAAGLATVGAIASPGEYGERCKRSGEHRMMMHSMGKHGRFADRDLDLTTEEVKTLVQARLIMRGNDRLKVGDVSEIDDDTYLVNIVTLDDSLVRQVEVDRDNGFPRGKLRDK